MLADPIANLAMLRIHFGYSLTDLAGNLDSTVARISAIERGKVRPTTDELGKLGLLFGITVGEIERALGATDVTRSYPKKDRDGGLAIVEIGE